MMNRNMLIYATIHLLNLLYINKIYRNSEGFVYFFKNFVGEFKIIL